MKEPPGEQVQVGPDRESVTVHNTTEPAGADMPVIGRSRALVAFAGSCRGLVSLAQHPGGGPPARELDHLDGVGKLFFDVGIVGDHQHLAEPAP